jgi:hypothetical protein
MRGTAISIARTRRRAAGVVCGAALLLAHGSARADDFQDHVDRAASLAKEERYTEALAEFDAAYALRQSPRLLYLRAKALQRLGDAKAAVAGYEGFLAADPDAGLALRSDAQAQIARLRPPEAPRPEPRPQALALGVPIRFIARDEANHYGISTGAGACDTPCVLELAPGVHTVSVTGDGGFGFSLPVPRLPGSVRVQHPYSGMLIAGIVLMTAGSLMMIGGNAALLSGALTDDGSGGNPGAAIAFGWVLGPIAHIVGIGLMGGGVAKLSDANTFQPLSFDLAPTAHGTTARMTLAF